MRKSLALALAASAVSAVVLGGTPAQAQQAREYPWCAQYGGFGGGGGRNCGFVNYGQCMAALSGNGGYCERNVFFRGSDYRAEAPPRRNYRRD